MQKSIVVSGEASETDSDSEVATPKVSPSKVAVHGEVITGEDSESEDDQGSVKSAVSALSPAFSKAVTVNPNEPQTFAYEFKYDSLLHKKLLECNKYLHDQVSLFTQHNIGEAAKSLSEVEQQLLQSQLTLEGAITSLRSLNANSIAIRNKLKDVLEADFLNTIRVDHK